jgi:hypothetical protein
MGFVMFMLRGSIITAALGLAIGFAAPAKADIFVLLTDAANDTPVSGTSTASQFQFTGSIGSFMVSDLISSVSTATFETLVNDGLTFTSTGAGTATLEVTETNLTSAAQVMNFASLFSDVTINGAGATLSRSTCFDPGNGPKGVGVNEPCFNMLASDTGLAAAAGSVAEIIGNSPFSISEDITFTTASTGGSTTPGGPDSVVAVSEPMSFAFLATGLLGLGLIRRRDAV